MAWFEPARVTRVDGGFEVKRWIFWTSGRIGDAAAPPKWGVEEIREFVGEDGEYRRSTIAQVDVDGTLCLEIPFSFR